MNLIIILILIIIFLIINYSNYNLDNKTYSKKQNNINCNKDVILSKIDSRYNLVCTINKHLQRKCFYMKKI